LPVSSSAKEGSTEGKQQTLLRNQSDILAEQCQWQASKTSGNCTGKSIHGK